MVKVKHYERLHLESSYREKRTTAGLLSTKLFIGHIELGDQSPGRKIGFFEKQKAKKIALISQCYFLGSFF
jgi:hypothetical protein